MALFLTPRFAPAYQAQQCNPFGFCAPASRPAYSCRVSRPQPRSFATQVDELLSAINHEAQRQAHIEAQRQAHIEAQYQAHIEAQLQAHVEAQREAHRQRQQRKCALRAAFAVSQNETGWQLDGDVHGFEQSNINIEVLDEHTIRVAGNTKWQSETQAQPDVSAEQQLVEGSQNDKTSNKASVEAETQSTAEGTETEPVTPAVFSSDTESHKSYQAFVEDDFEDLAAEASSLFSTPPAASTSAEVEEPKGKERAVEEPASAEPTITVQSQPEAPVQQTQQHTTEKEERLHGLFEQTFTFQERIDVNNVSASFKDGKLTVMVPKAQALQVRRIALL